MIFELSKLPGVGEKTATRLAYFILRQGVEYSQALSESILQAKQKTHLCNRCFVFTDQELCAVCAQPNRDSGVICIVEKPSDVRPIEQTGSYRGTYHVLHGVLSPLDGVGPQDLKIRELMSRLQNPAEPVREMILALNPSVEGDATALYLARLLAPLGLKVTKLAHGIPVGGQLEYTDRQTIGRAMENRMELHA